MKNKNFIIDREEISSLLDFKFENEVVNSFYNQYEYDSKESFPLRILEEERDIQHEKDSLEKIDLETVINYYAMLRDTDIKEEISWLNSKFEVSEVFKLHLDGVLSLLEHETIEGAETFVQRKIIDILEEEVNELLYKYKYLYDSIKEFVSYNPFYTESEFYTFVVYRSEWFNDKVENDFNDYGEYNTNYIIYEHMKSSLIKDIESHLRNNLTAKSYKSLWKAKNILLNTRIIP